MRDRLPFTMPTARALARYARDLAEDDPDIPLGVAYDTDQCFLARYLKDASFRPTLSVGVTPYAAGFFPPVVVYTYSFGGITERGTVYMQPDLARLLQLFDTFGRYEQVRAGQFVAAIRRHLPQLLEGER